MAITWQEHKNNTGRSIFAYSLSTEKCSATVISYGAILSHFTLTKMDGKQVDVVLGFDDPFQYEVQGKLPGYPFLGAFVGRACNRTANGTFALDGETFKLPINNGPNSLHGGLVGFDKQFFTPSIISHDPPQVSFEWTSPHLDQGFPGEVRTKISYSLIGSELIIDTYAELIDDIVKKTYVNLTTHPYFNLSGMFEESVESSIVHMQPSVEGCMELNEHQIPTGRILLESENPELFFYSPKALSESLPKVQQLRGFDHFFLIKKEETVKPFISVSCPLLKVKLDVKSSSRGFQFYTGNWLDGRFKGKASQNLNSLYGRYSGFCIEPSEPPNAINLPVFCDGVIVTRQKPWSQTISYSLSNSA